MHPPIKIALVGAGMFGGDVHARAYADLQRFGIAGQLARVGLDHWTRDFAPVKFELAAVATRSQKSAERARDQFAAWMVSRANRQFPRTIANRLWKKVMGVGLVEPVDDVRVSNPPSNPELLDALAARLVEYRYDFRRLIRDICNSRTYQLASAAGARIITG